MSVTRGPESPQAKRQETPSPVHPPSESPASSKAHGSSRLPSLDGWRAVSIAIVLGQHSRFTSKFPTALEPAFKYIFEGEMGVHFFFVISGFLITWLLL